MRRSAIITVLLIIPIVLLSGQTPSFMGTFSESLYRSELDAAFNVSEAAAGPVFSELKKFYIFAGLTNWFDLTTESASTTTPVSVGLFLPGSLPISLYASFSNATADSADENGPTSTTLGSVTVTSGTTTTNYTWVSAMTERQYAALETMDLASQLILLTRLSALNIGLHLQAAYENNVSAGSWTFNNMTETETHNYNTAGAGVVPVPALDYTVTTVRTAPDSLLTLDLAIPFSFPLGPVTLYNRTNIRWARRDQSSSTRETFSSPVYTPFAHAAVVADDTTINVLNSYVIDSVSTLSLKPLWGTHADNHLDIGLDAGVGIYVPDNGTNVGLVYDINFSAPGAAQQITAYDSDTTDEYTRTGHLDWRAIPNIQHFFYFEPAKNIFFALAPRLDLGVQFVSPKTGYTVRRRETVRDDVDSNGQYTAADTIVTTTTEYLNNGDDTSHFDMIAGCTLPVSFRFTLKDLPFEIVMANETSLKCTMSMYDNATNSTVTTTENADGTGAVTDTDIITGYSTVSYTKFLTDWAFQNNFSFGLNFLLPAGISLAVDLNFQNLLEFENLKAELIIPL